MADRVVDRDRLIKAVVGHHVQNRRKGFLQHRAGLRGQLNNGRAHVERCTLSQHFTVAKVHFGAGLACALQCLLHGLESALVNQGPHQRASGQRITDRKALEDTYQGRHQLRVDRALHDQAAQAGAALPRSARR